ncbi:MAG: tetratricopeptide repeat protein [Sphingomonadales bacterium]
MAATLALPSRAADLQPESVDDKTYLEAVVAASLANSRGDAETAFNSFLPLAERGHREAQYNVGFMTANGEGVEQNAAEAVKWYRRAADQNHEIAQLRLGLMLRDGAGAEKNVVRAHMWLSIAANQGQQEARESSKALAVTMTAEQLDEAQDMAFQWIQDHKDTD